MAHTLVYKEWETASGKWVCNDVSDLGGQAGLWWVPAHLLGMTPSEYVQWLIDTYHPDDLYYNKDTNFFCYSWTKEHYSLCHKFVLYINAQARKKKIHYLTN